MSQFQNSNNPPSDNRGSGTLVIIGVVLAVLAVILMNVYVEIRVDAAKQDTVTYFEFTGSLDAGTEIESNHIRPVEVPESLSLGQDAIRERPDRPGTPVDGLGFELQKSVIEGEVLRSSLFTGRGGGGIRGNPPDLGERQMAISVDSEDQPANLAPGDRIDLYGAIPFSRTDKNMVVMEYVEVAAVGERRVESGDGSQSSKYGSITINLDPEQVPLLLDIQRRLPEKQFRITLRAPNDTSTAVTGGEAVINPKVLSALRLD